jgi:hypothetical protein
MTLLDFEVHFRPAKIVKAREIYLKGHVAELKKSNEGWVAKMKIGSYRVHIDQDDISINGSSCNCDDRPHSGYCNHSVAVLFAIRKELDIFPVLSNVQLKLPRTDERLTDLLEVVRDPDFDLTKKYIQLFTNTANKMLLDVDKAIKQKKYAEAATTCFSVITGIQHMKRYMTEDYEKGDACIEKTFLSLEKWWQSPVDTEIRDAFAHDARLEAIRIFRGDGDTHKRWMEILLLSADAENRKEKLVTTIDKLYQVDKKYPKENSYYDSEKESLTLLEYKDRLLKSN